MQWGDPMELSSQSLEMQKQKIPMVRPQRLDDKNWVICLVIMFTPRVMPIKKSKMAHFSNMMLMEAQLVIYSAKYLSAPERSY